MMIINGLRYIQRHWRGELSLAVCFWINFLLPFCVFLYAEQFTLPPYLHGELTVTIAIITFVLITRLVVYPWQVVGVIRACNHYRKNHTDRSWAIVAEGMVVLSLAATLAATFSSYQMLLAYQQNLRAAESIEGMHNYSVNLINSDSNANQHGTLLHIRGPFQVGITYKVSAMLADNPQVTGIILDSGGGQIYEGRGLARLIKNNKLATYSLKRCASSCTTAFVAGTTRSLGRNAKLGFHQYKNYAALPIVDINQEHDKDLAIFKEQGVSAEFLQKIFIRSPQQMWWPEEEELLTSGVVHHTNFSLGDTTKK